MSGVLFCLSPRTRVERARHYLCLVLRAKTFVALPGGHAIDISHQGHGVSKYLSKLLRNSQRHCPGFIYTVSIRVLTHESLRNLISLWPSTVWRSLQYWSKYITTVHVVPAPPPSIVYTDDEHFSFYILIFVQTIIKTGSI